MGLCFSKKTPNGPVTFPYFLQSPIAPVAVYDGHEIIRTEQNFGYRITGTVTEGNPSVLIAKEITRESSNDQWEEVRDVVIKKATRSEIVVHMHLLHHHHPNLLLLQDYFSIRQRKYLVTPLIRGSDLYTTIDLHGALKEDQAHKVFNQVLTALLHLKEKCGVRHMDISCENVLISTQGHVYLIDYGLSDMIPSRPTPFLMKGHARKGKMNYIAPEIFYEHDHDPWAPDVWSLGCLLYVMLIGMSPYESPNDPAFERIKHGKLLADYNWRRKTYNNIPRVSWSARDLLCNMIMWQPEKRFSLEQVKKHSWVRKCQLLHPL